MQIICFIDIIYISPEPEQAIKQSWRLGTTSLLNRHHYQEWWAAAGLAAFGVTFR